VWGNVVSEEWTGSYAKAKTETQNLRFQGQYYDVETGLHYNTFRFYDPDIGRFTSPDPIGLAGGDNLYAYAPNSIRWVDPLGLHEILADSDIVCRAGTCLPKQFSEGTGVKVGEGGKLSGVSTQARPGAGIDVLSQPFKNGSVGVATVGQIEAIGGKITLDGKLNANGSLMANHATVEGITAEQASSLFKTQTNPTPKSLRGRLPC
jgi:RHS repeat-associated protein